MSVVQLVWACSVRVVGRTRSYIYLAMTSGTLIVMLRTYQSYWVVGSTWPFLLAVTGWPMFDLLWPVISVGNVTLRCMAIVLRVIHSVALLVLSVLWARREISEVQLYLIICARTLFSSWELLRCHRNSWKVFAIHYEYREKWTVLYFVRDLWIGPVNCIITRWSSAAWSTSYFKLWTFWDHILSLGWLNASPYFRTTCTTGLVMVLAMRFDW